MVLMFFVEPILKGIEQDDTLSELAGSFCVQLVWGIPPYYWFQVYTKYLQSQHILSPPVYMGIVANGESIYLIPVCKQSDRRRRVLFNSYRRF